MEDIAAGVGGGGGGGGSDGVPVHYVAVAGVDASRLTHAG